jgi:hypothetical protein
VSPQGSDSADGSQATPFKTIKKGIAVVAAGEMVLVKAGTYAETVALDDRSGTEKSRIMLRGEQGAKIVPSGAGGAMVQFRKPHWIVEGFDLDVQGKRNFAVSFQGNVTGATLHGNDIHGGTLGAGVTTYDSAAGALIDGNNIHHFKRPNDDSHGVLVQWTSKNIAIRNNEIHDNSGDAVQCIGPETFASATPANGVAIEGNLMFSNVENAVDIKTCNNVTVSGNTMRSYRPAPAGQGAKGDAVVIHMSASNVVVEDNEISDVTRGISLGGNREGPMPAGVIIRRNRIHNVVMEGGADGSGIRVENSEGAVVAHNTLTSIAGTALVVGGGTNGPSSNLSIKNNIVDAASALKVGTQAPGLTVNANMYAPGATFIFHGAAEGFEAWRARGYDASSFESAPGFQPGATPMTPAAAVDKGENLGWPYCGAAPDLGAIESGC